MILALSQAPPIISVLLSRASEMYLELVPAVQTLHVSVDEPKNIIKQSRSNNY